MSPAAFIAFMAGQHGWLCRLDALAATPQAGAVRAMPGAEPWFLGVSVWQGEVLSVSHFGAFSQLAQQGARIALADFRFMADEAAAGDPVPGQAPASGPRWLVFAEDLALQVALQVDRLVGLKSLERMQTHIDLEFSREGRPWIGASYRDEHDRIWRELRPEKLLEDTVFANPLPALSGQQDD